MMSASPRVALTTKLTTTMTTYTIKISAIGYETTTLTVTASTKTTAIKNETEALRHFATRNAISMSDARGFGSISYCANRITA